MTPIRWSDDETNDVMDSDPAERIDLVDIINRIELHVAVQEEFPLEDYDHDDTP